MITPTSMQSPELELWAQYHSVGPRGYADSDGATVANIGAAVAREVCNQPGQLIDICWVNFSLFIGEEPHRVGESIIATSQRRLREVSFRPVSAVIEEGRLTQHSSKWVGYLMLGDRNPAELPDRFSELVELLDDVQ